MPQINIQCPQGHLVAIEEQYLGRKVRCPHCQVIMIAPRPNNAAPVVAPLVEPDDDDDDDEVEETPKKRKKGGAYRAGMKQVARAYDVYYARVYLMVLTFFVIFISVIVMAVSSGESIRDNRGNVVMAGGMLLLMIGAGFVGLALTVMEIVGMVYLASTPERTEARDKYWLCLGLTIASYVMYIVLVIMLGNLSAPWGGILTQICYYAAFVVFIFYTKQIALHLDKEKLAKKAQGLIYLVGVVVLGVVMSLIAAASRADQRRGNDDVSTALGLLGGLIVLVAGIWSILRYIRLLIEIREALKKEVGTS